jgi:hypothetical protein
VQPREGGTAVTLRAHRPDRAGRRVRAQGRPAPPGHEPRERVVRGHEPGHRRQEPVQRVRVGLSPTSPLITEVSMELSRAAAHRIETSADKNELTVVFESPLAPPRRRARRRPRRRRCSRRPTARARRARRRFRRRAGGRAAARRSRATGRAAEPSALHRPPGQPRLLGRRPAIGAADLRRDQRPEHRHRPDHPGHRRRLAARRAVGSGARHHPARQPLGYSWTAPSSASRR